MAGNNDGGRLAVFIIIGILVVLFILFIAWWMMSPRAIVIPDCVQKQMSELLQLNTQQVHLTRELSIELVLNSGGADITKDVLLTNLNKSIPIVYGKDSALAAKDLSFQKVALLADVAHGGDLPTIEKEILEINTKLSVLYSQRLPSNLREEKGKQMLSVLNKYETSVVAMTVQYRESKYVESFASLRLAQDNMAEYTKLGVWTLVTCYSHDPNIA